MLGPNVAHQFGYDSASLVVDGSQSLWNISVYIYIFCTQDI